MSHNPYEILVRMINQIADNNRSYEDKEAAERVADHIKRFWARSMKADLAEYYLTDGTKLNPIARQAVAILQPADASTDDRISLS